MMSKTCKKMGFCISCEAHFEAFSSSKNGFCIKCPDCKRSRDVVCFGHPLYSKKKKVA